MQFRYRSSASRDAAAQRRADRLRDAGMPERPAPITLPPVLLDLRGAGGPYWRAEHAPGTCRWRVYDAETGERIMCAQMGGILTAVHRRTPRLRAVHVDPSVWSARDEADAAAAQEAMA